MASEARIRELYERDWANPRMAAHKGELPISFEHISPEWLTHVLCREHPAAKVVSLSLGPIDNGSTNRRRILVDYNEAGQAAGLPGSVFCKASHALRNRISLGLSGAAAGEVAFYNEIRSMLPIEAPVAYFAAYDPDSFNSMIMLRDEADRVAFGAQNTAIGRARAEAMVRLLATLHGTMHENDALVQGRYAVPTLHQLFVYQVVNVQAETYTNRGFRAAEAVIPERLFRRYSEIWPATVRSMEQHSSLPRTLAHGDTHLKNWYLMDDAGVGLMDWQMINVGSGVRDLAYALSVALEPEDRRNWERDLLSLYLDEFNSLGGAGFGAEALWSLYRQQLLSALSFWTITLSPSPELPADMQPAETAMKFIGRITTAIDDLDALDVVL